MPEMIDPATLELIERLDVYRTGLEEDLPNAESLFALEEALAALVVKLDRIADERDPAGNASNQADGLTPLEVAEALVQSMPVEIQQSGGDPIVVRETKIDFDPDTEAATDAPTRFWMRVDSGETFGVYVRRSEWPDGSAHDGHPPTWPSYIDDRMPAESQIYPLDR